MKDTIEWKQVGSFLLILARPVAIALVLLVPSKHWGALRFVAALALLVIFVATSAGFRKTLAEGGRWVVYRLDDYSPYSYVGVVAVVIVVFLASVSRGSR